MPNPIDRSFNHLPGDGEPAAVPPPAGRHGFWRNVWQVLKTVQARLRFVAILAAVGLIIGYWDTLKARYEKLTRPAAGRQAAAGDVEYFCPMHPQIVRDNDREKCPICFMPLSKRKKGE